MWAKVRTMRARLRITPLQACLTALRIAPWVTFGPISGVMSERAIRCYRNGDQVLAVLYVVANVSVLLGIPSLTAILAKVLL
jgi:hypothetical protein